MCTRLEALGALRPGLTPKRAVDQAAALFAAEVYEELTSAPLRWSPEDYERWPYERLREVLLGGVPEPRSSG